HVRESGSRNLQRAAGHRAASALPWHHPSSARASSTSRRCLPARSALLLALLGADVIKDRAPGRPLSNPQRRPRFKHLDVAPPLYRSWLLQTFLQMMRQRAQITAQMSSAVEPGEKVLLYLAERRQRVEPAHGEEPEDWSLTVELVEKARAKSG